MAWMNNMTKHAPIPGVHPDRINDEHYKSLGESPLGASPLGASPLGPFKGGMESKGLHLEVRNKYGRPLIYPMCEKSKEIAAIGRKMTILFEAIPHILNLGFTIKWDGLKDSDINKLKELGVEL